MRQPQGEQATNLPPLPQTPKAPQEFMDSLESTQESTQTDSQPRDLQSDDVQPENMPQDSN